MTDQSHSRLERSFRDAGIDARPREDCPDPDRIWAAVRLELPLEQRLAIIDHVATCPVCAEAWRIAMALRERESGAPSVVGWRVMGWRHHRVLAWGFAAAAVLLVAAGITLGLRVWRDRDHRAIPQRPAIAFALQDGEGRVTVDTAGRIEGLPALPAADRQRIESAIVARRLAPLPLLKELGDTTSGPLMGSGRDERFGVLAPVGTAVESDRPTFRWQPLNGARDYQVRVSDPAAGYREVAASPVVQATTWISPQPLPRGRTYVWQVVARTRAGEVKSPSAEEAEARFMVLTGERANAVEDARARYAGRHLLLGLLYYNAGVVDRAREELQALVAQNPASPEARALLASIDTPARTKL